MTCNAVRLGNQSAVRFLHDTIFQYHELLLPQSGCEIETIKQLKVKVINLIYYNNKLM